MSKLAFAFVILLAGSQLGCQKHPEVPEKECPQVVSHARKLLGDRADPASKMLAECKKASGQERGCAMAADSAADLLRCSM